MSCLRMQHTMQQLTVYVYAAANAGANGQVDDAFLSFGLPEGHFPQHRPVHVRVKTHRTAKRFPKSADNIIIPPRQLRRSSNMPILRRLPVQFHRPETPDPQSVHLLILKISDQLRHGNLRRFCGNGDLLEDFPRFVSYGAYHFGTARFQCSQSHESLFSALPCARFISPCEALLFFLYATIFSACFLYNFYRSCFIFY